MSIPSPVPGMPAPPPADEAPPTPRQTAQIVPPPGLFAPTPSAAPTSPADDLDRTIVVAPRRKLAWTLVVDGGPTLPLTASRVVLGLRPTAPGDAAQPLAIPDATRTLSKVHARLDLVDGVWTVTDLDATNGVIVVAADGSELLLDPGATAPVVERLRLGRVGMRLVATEDVAP